MMMMMMTAVQCLISITWQPTRGRNTYWPWYRQTPTTNPPLTSNIFLTVTSDRSIKEKKENYLLFLLQRIRIDRCVCVCVIYSSASQKVKLFFADIAIKMHSGTEEKRDIVLLFRKSSTSRNFKCQSQSAGSFLSSSSYIKRVKSCAAETCYYTSHSLELPRNNWAIVKAAICN